MARLAKNESSSLDHKPHVGIVGAGFAGLRCADVLLQHGFRVTIIEARNRLGGRIHQERLPNGHFVDMGANWIHGTEDNPILDMAKETNTAVEGFDHPALIIDDDGEPVPAAAASDYSVMMWNIIADAFAVSNKHGSDIDPAKTLLDFFKEQVLVRVPETEGGYEKKRRILLHLAESWGAFVGGPVARQSLKFFWLEECIDGENLFCAGSYHNILKMVAQPVVAGADIKLQTKVSDIYGKSVTGTNTVRIKTVDGHALDFDELVVTTPLGWLKQNTKAFHPLLPDRLSQAIQNIGYGSLEKVYISFPTPFWLDPSPDGRPPFKGFCQLLSPTYDPASNPSRWNNELVELGSIPSPDGHPTLLFYTFGPESHHLTSTVRSLPTETERKEFLFAFFKPYYSRLPSYREADPDCQATAYIATDWLHDEFAGNGSYCNFQTGLQEGDKDILEMRAGVPEEGIWLAGEHTAPFVALGTVTGAYWSGEDVARRVIRACETGERGRVDVGGQRGESG
ncbi:hypothetical protein QBC39DRAFT_367951 [Podospora conica]|nr:hypothetical protein QBC39DRAFT_367951 [Schizothecium conicum]